MFLTKDGITVKVSSQRAATHYESLGYRPVEQSVEVAEVPESAEAPKPKRTPAKRVKKGDENAHQ